DAAPRPVRGTKETARLPGRAAPGRPPLPPGARGPLRARGPASPRPARGDRAEGELLPIGRTHVAGLPVPAPRPDRRGGGGGQEGPRPPRRRPAREGGGDLRLVRSAALRAAGRAGDGATDARDRRRGTAGRDPR